VSWFQHCDMCDERTDEREPVGWYAVRLILPDLEDARSPLFGGIISDPRHTTRDWLFCTPRCLAQFAAVQTVTETA
jgi:hypothetical protein